MKLQNNDGQLTAYAFTCGYIQMQRVGIVTISLEMPSPGVRAYYVVTRPDDKACVRRLFHRLTPARVEFKRQMAAQVRIMKNKNTDTVPLAEAAAKYEEDFSS